MTSGPTPRQRAAHIADVMSDFLPRDQVQPLENQIAHAIDQALAAQEAAAMPILNQIKAAAQILVDKNETQAAALANALAYCIDADNEARQQAAIIRRQQEQIAELAERAKAARNCLIGLISTGQARTHGQPIEADEHADKLITQALAELQRRHAK